MTPQPETVHLVTGTFGHAGAAITHERDRRARSRHELLVGGGS